MDNSRFSGKKKGFLFLLIPAIIALLSAIIMWLWNAILPDVLKVGTITFWQAMGLFVLCRLLFGGFKPGGPGGAISRFKNKWQNMSEEEREKFKTEWKKRCGRC